MTQTIFRIHPTINFARVGDSEEYYIAPETAAGEIVQSDPPMFGGLPIRPGTDDTPITAEHLRDSQGRVKRQAARFRLFAYDDGPQTRYPSGCGREVSIGSTVATSDGPKTIRDIVWMVHLANKKANNYMIADNGQELGILAYENGRTPPIRNAKFGSDLGAPDRRRKLVIDAGPRALLASTAGSVTLPFDDTTTPTTFTAATNPIVCVPDYPVSFPFMHFDLLEPQGRIDTLGEMTIEEHSGRLLVVGGYGRAAGIIDSDRKPPLDDAIDNDNWFDDTSDGPVRALVIFHDGTWVEAVGAWFVCTDPGYAPQVRNVVSTWDDILSTWVEKLDLIPDLFSNGQYNP
ncbi:MAG: hypothetical protein D6757_10215, partial [Alphaproteobacteria bacterium]